MSVILEETSRVNFGKPLGRIEITPELKQEVDEMIEFSLEDINH